jgi:hypothetical protein
MIGREILALRIERLLAEGGMGAVYLARHVHLPGTHKVIKVLLPKYAAHAMVRQPAPSLRPRPPPALQPAPAAAHLARPPSIPTTSLDWRSDLTARVSIFIALLSCMLAFPAWADDPALAPPREPDALSHYLRGNRLFRARHIGDALAAYHAGLAIEPAPVFDYNLGQCYRKLGQRADAIRHFERFLERGRPEGAMRDLVTGFLRQLREERTKETLLRPPSGISPPRSAPSPPPPPKREPPTDTPSPPTLSAPAPDAPSPSPILSAPAPVAPSPSPILNAPSPDALSRQPSGTRSSTLLVRRPRWYADRLGWGLVAGGLAAAGGALYLHGRAVALAGDVAPAMDEDRRIELRDATYVRGIASTVLGIAGAVLIAAGVTRLAIRAGRRAPALTGSTAPRDIGALAPIRSSAPTSASGARWSLGLSSHGVAVLGRF